MYINSKVSRSFKCYHEMLRSIKSIQSMEKICVQECSMVKVVLVNPSPNRNEFNWNDAQ